MPLGKILLAAVLAWGAALPAAEPGFPADHRLLRAPISYAVLGAYLKSVAKPGFITVSEEGRSAGGRALYLVRLNRGGPKATFRVFFYAQQHGNEVSGKDAQAYLVRAIAERPELLPEDVDLYLMPMVNPDGAEANRRVNGAEADLNRDHLRLQQPETQALYRVARRVLPHLAVDSHEFTRDGKDYQSRGWDCWPLITMDALNHPLIPAYLKEEGLRMVESARPVMAQAGYPYSRYTVGGLPPDQEIRPSTPEVDDGRNGLGSHGALSFIIEAGVLRSAPEPQADLGARVDAYLKLYRHLLGSPESRARVLALAEQARREPLPAWIASTVFWANLGGRTTLVPMGAHATGKLLQIPSPNVMLDLVVKASVPTPRAYAIEPRVAALFRPLLEHHGLRFEALLSARKVRAEACRLLRLEVPYDELYQRYGDRQIVSREPAAEVLLAPGTLLVPLDQPLARRAIQVLEPCLLYGLYGYPEFRALVAADGRLPVLRLPQAED